MSNENLLVVLNEWEKEDFLPPPLWSRLEKIFPQLQYHTPDEIAKKGWARVFSEVKPSILITGWRAPPLPPEVGLARESGLKYLCHLPGSVRKLVPRLWIENGLIVSNWGRSISHVVAECGLMMIISGLRRAGYWNYAMHRNGAWKTDALDTQSLFGRRVGIHGFGAISRCLVKLMEPFGVEVSTYSPSVSDEGLAEYGVQRSNSLEELFSENHIIVELAALTPEAEGIVGERLLRMIPEGGLFVNIGRGAVVDEDALIRTCAEGKIHAALDVYCTEPLPADSPLRKMENVLLLPHLGGPTVDQRQTAGAYGLANIERYLSGNPLESVVTLDIYDRAT
ncbi:hydroxyacid dehydrogenase [Cerasicoccus arenae]|uniref:Glycerate dehydrogenase n=1 Tax=Cerasicoccus arenae TaxID=424488 RepID=A0A8J3DGY2_9BACT|nr:hydroxyacid dehydrogenase [Cerasicoccus arenae]MBK1857955.1 hydroxyacid dehydrogenase [Cerasicoccus arenae]GHB97839.1 glycerate dehydrogenase [Cerasicoccus arenae]